MFSAFSRSFPKANGKLVPEGAAKPQTLAILKGGFDRHRFAVTHGAKHGHILQNLAEGIHVAVGSRPGAFARRGGAEEDTECGADTPIACRGKAAQMAEAVADSFCCARTETFPAGRWIS